MTAQIVVFFNAKGGAGQTSIVYNLAWMYAQLGVRVVAADLDPQARLTILALGEERMEKLSSAEPSNKLPSMKARTTTIYRSVAPLFEGAGDVAPLEPLNALHQVLEIAADESWSAAPSSNAADSAWDAARQSIEHFRHWIEDRDGWRELWDMTNPEDPRPRPEKTAQRLFYLAASVFCKHSNLDIIPEADTGRGPVDFKIASGFSNRVLVELKLSSSASLFHGYRTRLELYKKAERTTKAFYLIIDVGGMRKKLDAIYEYRDAALERGEAVSEVVVVNASPKKSASKA